MIEVNTNPCLEESSGILKVLLPRMLDDMLKLTIDLIFPKSGLKLEGCEIYEHPNYELGENIWEEIFDLKTSSVKNISKENCLTSLVIK